MSRTPFRDEVKIKVVAGKGGDGCVSFRREKFVPKGGPDGGDGGDGGSVYIKVNPNLKTLSHIYPNETFKAGNGKHGRGKSQSGAKGEDIFIEVPQGTEVIDAETNKTIADLVNPDDVVLVAKGGKGGRGNEFFKSPTNQTPMKAEKGKPGEKKTIILRLKIVADVGLVGLPNAGKSSLLSALTRANPKIASYPFTTLHPNLGVVKLYDSQLVIADIPGLIEGAHEGKGLGIDFLKHIERTKAIAYVLDVIDSPEIAFKTLQNELKSYPVDLTQKPYLIVLNKSDLIAEDEKTSLKTLWEEEFKVPVFVVSAVSGENINELIKAMFNIVSDL